ncbi:ABC transporter ATP-binding protein [Sulfitobacter mediterraneus]|uniref:dipeptide ABC transporter ATP-binding protein n=1 Tax=Sulfitobacter mediterraneus TaxID=83219 RepID=UPI0019343D0C|nr:ABC transporter ATP-binding protein [Sulfitobacter mediterraneus]MBM1635179.1 ABC transporter ATP-binding protein [Sulfitobacter mediterraneus]MBM1643030.1 ABC transporter ATP-binding protein [Sulfitobacter mediterraneus]MBM1647078.1 ABC transporter ATP-binding protein [Sulfitobacter mediterraneus]MBM1651120.1 ABC transporter ATP-binding protein [Sulfitobacter mediterraneus]MBM1655153.1 ABC transporter ATP-binding protein [Sulfitobacter mediterraneus]
MTTLLSVKDLSVRFGKTVAVDDVSFDLEKGAALGIVGESGSGKSVTCRALMRLLPGTARIGGTVEFDGQNLLQATPSQLEAVRGRRIAMIFQSPASHLDPLMRIGDQVAQALHKHMGLKGRAAREEVIRLLDLVRIPEPRRWARAYPHQLSGGMKQRAMIAGALACDPDLLLADEPTTALDATVQKSVLDLLAQLRRERNLSMIFVSHDLGAVAQVCDDLLVMRKSKLVESGPVSRIIDAPEHEYTHKLISSHPDRLPIREVVSATRGDPLLEGRDLQIRYGTRNLADLFTGREGGFVAVKEADIRVRPGETLGIVGESGSGKSTIARALVGLIKPAKGTIAFDGQSVDPAGANRKTYLRDVQLIYQHPFEALSPRMTVKSAIAEPLKRHRLCPVGKVGERVRDLMQQVDLSPDLAGRLPGQLSGGQCQRVAIARALAFDPKVIIADEVTSALDVTLQAQVMDLLMRLQKERGLTMIFISHDLGVIRRLCNSVIVMRRGEIVEAGATGAVFDNPQQAYTRELIEAIPHLHKGVA